MFDNSEAPDPTSAAGEGQLTRLKLAKEIAKLDVEIDDLKRSDLRRPSFWLSSVTPVAALLALVAQFWWATAKFDSAQARIDRERAQFAIDGQAWDRKKDAMQQDLDRARAARSEEEARLTDLRARFTNALSDLGKLPVAPYVIENTGDSALVVIMDSGRESHRIAPHDREIFLAARMLDRPTFYIYAATENGRGSALLVEHKLDSKVGGCGGIFSVDSQSFHEDKVVAVETTIMRVLSFLHRPQPETAPSP